MAVRSFMVENIQGYTLDASGTIYTWIHEGDRISWEVGVRAYDPGGVMVIVSTCPFDVEPSRRASLGRFVSLLNYQSIESVFALQPELGELTIKSSVFLGSPYLTTQISLKDAVGLVEYMVDENLATSEEVIGSVARLLQGLSSIEGELVTLEGL